MITCKEDLMNTYIINDKGALRDAYLAVCGKFNLHNLERKEFKSEFYTGAYIVCNSYSLPTSEGLLQDHNSKTEPHLKKLVMSDLKPTRTEYVNVKCSIFDLKAEFEAGELYQPLNDDSFELITGEVKLCELLGYGLVYRKVEREVTWQGELMAAIRGGSPIGESSVRVGDADLTDDQFIEMCHKVYHLTK